MTGIAILDVAAGLVFVLLLLGLLCTIVSEWIAQGARLRARTLRQGIEVLLDDAKFKRVTESVYEHPLVAGLKHGEREPSYIPGSLFAKAFLAVTEKRLAAIGNDLSPGSFFVNIERIFEKYEQLKMEIYRKGQICGQRVEEAAQVLEQLRQRERALRKSGATPGEVTTAEAQLNNGENHAKNAQREQDDYNREYLGYTGTMNQKLAQLEAEQHCYRHIAEVLRSFVAETASVADLERHLAHWYDQAMIRVSGRYRKKMLAVTLAVAAAVALLFNADTIGMARTIWLDGEIRDVIRRSADTTAARCSLSEIRAGDRPACSIEELILTMEARRRLPLGWHSDAMPLSRGACPEGDVLRRARDEARRIVDDGARPLAERTEADLRLKRAEAEISSACAPRITSYLVWLLGLALGVVGLSFGAIFWFDVLKRFVTMRSSGNAPPAES